MTTTSRSGSGWSSGSGEAGLAPRVEIIEIRFESTDAAQPGLLRGVRGDGLLEMKVHQDLAAPRRVVEKRKRLVATLPHEITEDVDVAATNVGDVA